MSSRGKRTVNNTSLGGETDNHLFVKPNMRCIIPNPRGKFSQYFMVYETFMYSTTVFVWFDRQID